MNYVCSWSGGKDSALALWRARAAIGPDACLLTMFTEDDRRSRAHGLSKDVLAAQAQRMGLPLVTGAASWDDYTPVFVGLLKTLKRTRQVGAAVFGDIDLEPHRDWCLRACAEAGIECVHPLWGEPRDALVRECLAAGIRATIIAVKEGVLSPDLLGRLLDEAALAELAKHGVDLAGEQGEYHTVVVDGPMFDTAVTVQAGRQVLRDGYWFLDMALSGTDVAGDSVS